MNSSYIPFDLLKADNELEIKFAKKHSNAKVISKSKAAEKIALV